MLISVNTNFFENKYYLIFVKLLVSRLRYFNGESIIRFCAHNKIHNFSSNQNSHKYLQKNINTCTEAYLHLLE